MGKKSKRKKARQTTAEVIAEMRPLEPEAAPVRSVISRWISLHVLLIILLSLLAYSNTFESSFYFDDKPVIVKNPIIKDLRYFAQPSSARNFGGNFEYQTFKRRYFGYLTFALNYRFAGLNVTGYHILNLLIHISTALLLYFFVIISFRTPFLRKSSIEYYARYIALFTALLFACHPLQTQAVTYIWQRVTSLSTMFYLLSLVAFIKWRLSREGTGQEEREEGQQTAEYSQQGREAGSRESKGRTIFLYLISLFFAVVAMKTKEIAFMLPVMLTLYEMIFFEGKMKKRVLYLIPFLLTMLIIPLTLISIDKPIGDLIGDASETIKGHTELSRGEYLLAEFRVLITYLRLIFLPVNQNLDYDYPRYYSFFNIEVFTSFVFLALLFGVSIYLLYRYRVSVPQTRLISFGIIWFFVNLLLESSVIPLNNVIFEHRMYLPSVGVFSALTVAIFMVINRWKEYSRIITVILALIIIALTGATYARNSVWKDGITLWQDVVSKSPNNARAYHNLGNGYSDQGLFEQAIEQYQISIRLSPVYPQVHYNLGVAYESIGMIGKAIEHSQIAINQKPDYPEAHNNLGVAYVAKGMIKRAIEQYKIAKKLDPVDPEVHINLAAAYIKQGRLDDAVIEAREAIRLDASNADAYINLSSAYRKLRRHDEAIKAAEQALEVKPDYAVPYNNLGLIYAETRQFSKAKAAFNKAVSLDNDYTEAYSNLGALNMVLRKFYAAIEVLNKAAAIDPNHINARLNLGLAYFYIGKQEAAMKEYSILLKLSPDHANKLFSIISSDSP
jgi:tetratricopeptide (TPR) repeat protein